MRLALCAVAVLVGCNDGTVKVDTTQDNFCEQIADVACHNMYQCCTEHEIESALRVTDPRTELQCRDDLRVSCERASADIQDSLQAGRVTFDAMRLNECLNSIVSPKETCADVVTELPWKETCKDSAFVGTVAIGGACFFDFDCTGAPDNFCAANQKCTAKPTAGLPCGTGCASAYYCGTGGLCAPKLGAGAMCTTTSQCAMDLYCDTNQVPAVCAAKQPGGAACSSSLGCVSGECIPGQCMGTTQTCYKDTECTSHCAGTTTFCSTSSNCSTGTCSVGGNLCSSNTSCIAGGGDTCVFPIQCVPGDCLGEPVCTNATITVDYCAAVSAIPVL